MARNKKLGILTGGGDVPGLNSAIKAAVELALDQGGDALGIRLGWGGLLWCNPDSPQARKNLFVPLTRIGVRTIDRTGGTFLHTSRTNPQRVKAADIPDFLEGIAEPIEVEGDTAIYDFTTHVLNVLDFLEVDALIPIGGDDTLSYAARLHQEGFPVVAIPKTMDNDVYGTDYCIGFSTAVTRSVEAITNLRTTSGSHERITVVELFGRNSGETSLISAYLADVDRALISEGHDLVRRCIRRDRPGPYQLQAAIQAVHCAAETFEETDWDQIVTTYDQLSAILPTPVVLLNRAIALGERDGPNAALDAIEDIATDLATYHPLHAARATMLRRLGRLDESRAAFEEAARLAPTLVAQHSIASQIDELIAAGAG